MADIRELVTLFTFKMEEAGINNYKRAIEGLKESAKTLAGMFGLAFGAEKIYSFVEGLVDAGKEANKLIYQIQRLARPSDDLSNISDTLLKTATGLGVAYLDVAETFKGLLRDSQELEISQDGLVKTTENIYKAMRVERLSPAEMKQTMETVEGAFRRGQFTSRTIGRLISDSPEVAKVMAEALTGGSIEKLREMAAQKGGLTSEKFIEAMSKRNARLDADFAKAPVKLSQALTNIYSQLTVIAGKFFKMIDNSVFMAQMVTWAFDKVVAAVKTLIYWLGGAETALRLFSIALAVIATIKFLPWIYAAIRGMNLLTAAGIRAALVYGGWAIAIAAVVVALEDIYVWMTGGKSVIGSWIGPFDQFKKMLEDLPIVKLLTSLKDFATLDFTAGIKKFKEALADPIALLHEMETLIVVAIPAAFIAWNVLKFTGIISALTGVTDAVKSVAKEATGVSEVAGAAGTKAGTSFAENFTKVLGQIAIAVVLAELMTKIQPEIDKFALSQHEKIKNFLGFEYLPKSMQPKTPEEKAKEQADPRNQGLRYLLIGTWGQDANAPGTKRMGYDKQEDTIPKLDFWNNYFNSLLPGMGKLGQYLGGDKPANAPGSVAPGALGPRVTNTGPVNNSVNPALTMNNNISVTTQPQEAIIAGEITKQLGGFGNNLLDQAARQISGAGPRVEKAVQ